MSDGQNTSTEDNTPALTPEELASVEVGQRGFAEPTNVNTPAESGPQRPDWCPEQFWKDGSVDNEGLAKSYASLRSKMDSKPADTPSAEEAAAAARPDGKIDPAAEATAEETSAPAPVTAAMDAAAAEWAETQELSEDTYASLEAAGLPKQIVDLYLDGLRASSEKMLGEIHSFVGGADAYNSMTQWAAANLSEAEIQAYNEALDNPALRETAVVGLHAKFSRAIPSEGNLVIPNDGGAVSSDVFQSRDELVAAQKDPRYGTDPAYRKSVMDKLARSQGGGFTAFERPMFGRQVISN